MTNAKDNMKVQGLKENTFQIGSVILQSTELSLVELIGIAKQVLNDDDFKRFLQVYAFKEASTTGNYYG